MKFYFCKSWEMKCISRIVRTGITCLKDMLLSVKNTREKFTSKVKTKIVMFRLVVKFTRYNFTQCLYLIPFILVSVGKFSLLLSICFLCLSFSLFFNGIFFSLCLHFIWRNNLVIGREKMESSLCGKFAHLWFPAVKFIQKSKVLKDWKIKPYSYH